MPAKDQSRVKDALLAMQQDPFSGDIRRLKGQPPLGGVASAITASSMIYALKNVGLSWPEFSVEPQLLTRSSNHSLRVTPQPAASLPPELESASHSGPAFSPRTMP